MNQYNYRLLNNHYVVEIDGHHYIIDTGYPVSYSFKYNLNKIVIDGNEHQLYMNDGSFNIAKTTKLVGEEVDGLIGADIFGDTGLTFLKNNGKDGQVVFGIQEVAGRTFPLVFDGHAPKMYVQHNGRNVFYCLDTGARYAYCVSSLVQGLRPFETGVWDYNPHLGDLYSDNYHVSIDIDGRTYQTTCCYNPTVARSFVMAYNFLMVGNITDLFCKTCCLNYKEKKIVLD